MTDGEVFAGYTVERLLGVGGMGEVYLVRHPRLPRLEALKILGPAVSANPEYRRRFAREADIAASLWHSHVVAVHDRGEYQGQLWIAMDYVEGTDAAQLMRDRYPYGMPPKKVLQIVSAIADALDYAHERHLLHRDVKPANILITDSQSGNRRIMLTDFGIARDFADMNGITATDMAVGTLVYAAPEQLAGKALDGRADQYALAATAFHLLSGKPPPLAHLSSSPPKLSGLGGDHGRIDRVIAKAMEKEPVDRFDTCRAFAAALARGVEIWNSSSESTQRAAKVPEPIPESSSKFRRIHLIAAGGVALLAVGIVAFIGARLAQPDATPSAPVPEPSTTWPRTYAEDSPSTLTQSPSTVTYTPPPVTITRPGGPPTIVTPPPTTSSVVNRGGDLGLTTPISRPSCNGQGIVVLGSVTTPGLYADGVQRLLSAHPGSYYLRTDQACPSLRQATDDGNPIYAVFIPGGTTQSAVCAKVRTAGGGAYGKWLNYTTDPGFVIPC